MGMLLLSKTLLKIEIKANQGSDFYRAQVERELAVLEKLDIVLCDMRGTAEEVEDRLKNCEILFVEKDTYESMKRAVEFKQAVEELLTDQDGGL